MLGLISFLTAMSSAMVYGLLPIFLVKVLGATMASVGIIEGIAEAATSLTKIISGRASDWIGRRKPLVFLGYALSAVNKLLFPLAGDASTILMARVIDRIGKGMRDAPRDAFLTDVTPTKIRGSGFGLRLAFYTTGFVVGPLAAIGLMRLSDDNFRLVFWIAVIPAVMAIIVLLLALKEPPKRSPLAAPRFQIRRSDLARFAAPFWWAIAVASLLSLARFSLGVPRAEGPRHRHRCGIRADHAGPHAPRLCGGRLSIRCSRRSHRPPNCNWALALPSSFAQISCWPARTPSG